MIAEIIVISNEVLFGEELNTSTKYISKELTSLGIDINNCTTINYNKARLTSLFDDALTRSDIVLILGGLGVYKYNQTKDVVSKKFDEPLSFNQDVYMAMVDNLKKEKRYDAKVTKALLAEAYIMENSIELICKYSTTCGFIYNSKENKHVICLPIENKELISMYLESVKPYLLPRVQYCFLETSLELRHSTDVDLYKVLEYEMLKPYPKVRLRLVDNKQFVDITVKARTEEDAKLKLDKYKLRINRLLKTYI